MADTTQPMSPEWWIRRLYTELRRRDQAVEKAREYYDGVHNLAFSSQKFRETFGGLFNAFADNWCEVVVDAAEERLNVLGFRVSPTEPNDDTTARDIWQRNEMDAQSQMAHQEALITGRAFGVVWVDRDGNAEITMEPSSRAIVDCHPKLTKQRRAGLRVWCDDDGYEHAELFLPKDVHLYRSVSKLGSSGMVDFGRTKWTVDEEPAKIGTTDGNGRMVNPFGVVPVIEFQNRPRSQSSRKAGPGVHSEIRSIMPLQDAVNKLIADMLTASESAAFPQRYATGWEFDTDPETGAALPPSFKQGAGTIWATESATAQLGQFMVADLGNFVKAIELVINHIAAISRTPPHYLSSSADRLSGESIKAAETGLVAKVKRKQVHFGEAWEELIRTAGIVEQNASLAGAFACETIWADPESRTEAEHIDAVSKKSALGVPQEQLWEDAGYSPSQIERMKAMAAAQALMAPPVIQQAPVGMGMARGGSVGA
ncbi:MAG: phage portal protein [Ilumatobacteraceae bacterium]